MSTEHTEAGEQTEQTTAVTDEQVASETPATTSTEQATEPDEEVVVTIGDAEPPAATEEEDGPGLVNKLRKLDREKAKRIRELEQKLSAKETAEQPAEVAKPTLADCDYDEDAFAEKLSAWKDSQARIKAEQEKAAKAQEDAHKAWQASLENYGKAKASLKVQDYEDAESVVASLFNTAQKGIIIHAADNPALLEYAIGKNPAKAKELAAITDPVKFAFAVAKLETQVKATPRKAPPPPESVVSGSSSVAVDTQLAKLEAEADRTGDRSKVIAYRRQQREKQAA
jgi:hypothetical protein